MLERESVTQLLRRWSQGDTQAFDELMGEVYDELRGIAGQCFRRERSEHTLQATALLHEAVLRLMDLEGLDWKEAVDLAVNGENPDLETLDAALANLEARDPQKARIVELRFFVGLTGEEIARCLDVSVPTVTREWRRARTWLYSEIKGEDLDG